MKDILTLAQPLSAGTEATASERIKVISKLTIRTHLNNFPCNHSILKFASFLFTSVAAENRDREQKLMFHISIIERLHVPFYVN